METLSGWVAAALSTVGNLIQYVQKDRAKRDAADEKRRRGEAEERKEHYENILKQKDRLQEQIMSRVDKEIEFLKQRVDHAEGRERECHERYNALNARIERLESTEGEQ